MSIYKTIDLFSEWYKLWSNDCIFSIRCTECKFSKNGVCNDFAKGYLKLLTNGMIDEVMKKK